MESLGKVPSALGGARPKDGTDIHVGIDIDSLGEILPPTFAKSAASKPSQENIASQPFASGFPTKKSLQVDLSLSTENAHLKDQVMRLNTLVKHQQAAQAAQ